MPEGALTIIYHNIGLVSIRYGSDIFIDARKKGHAHNIYTNLIGRLKYDFI